VGSALCRSRSRSSPASRLASTRLRRCRASRSAVMGAGKVEVEVDLLL
jgi:hypothetical protein